MLYAFGVIIAASVVGIAFIVLRRLPEYGVRKVQQPEESVERSSYAMSRGFVSLGAIKSFFAKFTVRTASTQSGVKQSSSVLNRVSLGAIKSEEHNEDFWIGLIEKDPENPYLYKKLGEFYVSQGKRQFARETFQYALKLSPDDENIKERLKEV